MSTTFPTTKQTIPNPTATDLLENASPTLDHDYQHATINDTVEALEDKVGIDGSVVTTSHSYKLALITGANQAVSTDGTGQTLTNITLTNPQMNFGGDATGDMYYRSALGTTARLPIGTAGQIIQTSVAGIPEWTSNPSAADASTTVKGVVEEATQAEVIAGTATGGTGARLFVNPSTLISSLTSIIPSVADISLPAGETITAGQAVYLGYYQTGSAISYDNKNIFSDSWSGTSTPISNSFTVGNNSNRVLIVSFGSDFAAGGVGSVSAISYGGVPMTLLQSSSANIEGGLFYLVNPTVGANNLTYTVTSGAGPNNGKIAVQVYSIYNATYSTSNKAVTSQTSITEVIPTYGDCIGFAFKGGNPGSATQTSNELTNNTQSGNDTRLGYFSGISDIIDVGGSSSITFNPGTYSTYDQIYSISFTPANAPTTGYAKLATASNAYLGTTDRYVKFLGFATTSASVTQTVYIKTDGYVSGLSGLSTNSLYYLSNTKGAVATSAGTNSKKIGIALSATTLLMKDSI